MPENRSLITQIDATKLPQHIAVIMDGNGRWAQQLGKERIFGHQHGVEAVRNIIEAAGEAHIPYLTLYAFSVENWNRPKEEVDMLMLLLSKAIHNELDGLMKNNVRLQTIGNLQALPATCRQELQDAIATTAKNSGLTVVLALSYSARWELTEMAKKIASESQQNRISPDDITAETVAAMLTTAHIPDPDILIRTGAEQRVSNFLLWQIAYTELFFLNIMWPEFRKENLWQIIIDYQARERRFGKTGDQCVVN